MVTAEELTVAIRSEGIGETQQDLEGVEQSMQDTADSAGKSAEELEGFSQRFQGAMSAAVAALAIGAAGLASQVPVLGESFAGLGAIVDALAFRVDSVLRPALSPVTNKFFEWSNAIYEADGALGTFIGLATTVASVLLVAIPLVAKIGSVFGAFSSTAAGISTILGTVAGAVGTVIGAIASLPAVVIVAIAAIAAFAVAYLTNWRGVRDKTNAIIGSIVNFVVSGFKTLGTKALNAVTEFAGDVRTFFTDLASDLSEWASNVASDAYDWGKNLIQRFTSGIQSALSTLKEFLGDLRDIGANVGIDVPSLGSLNIGGGGGSGGSGGSGRPTFRGSGGSGTTVLDGRQITESTGRYRSGPARRRNV